MISRSSLVGALVVAELVIVAMGAKAVAGGDGPPFPSPPAAFVHESSGSPALDRTFVAGAEPHVVIDVHDAEVYVQGANVQTVRVLDTIRRSGWVSGDAPAVSAQQTPDGVRVASAAGGGVAVFFGSFSHEVHVTVPAGARVDFTNADLVDVTGLRAKLLAHVPDGAIRVRDHRGDVDVSTGSGRITMTDVQGDDIAANTRDGRIYLTRVGADRMDASSASGRIVGVDVRAVNGALTTRDGRVIISFTGNSDATVSAHTADGNVHVSGFPATPSGDDRSSVKLGAGRGTFDVSTQSGSITITQGANV